MWENGAVFGIITLMLYYNKSINATLKELGSSPRGLHPSEVADRRRVYGPNSLKITGEPLWRKLVEPFANVFMAVLGLAAIISILHGDTLDAVIILVIMAASGAIYYVQRFSTERILRSLQRHSAQAVEVTRDGKTLTLDTTELVPGDIITLREGEKVPADARLIDGSSVRADESLLTGESVPISKTLDALAGEKQIYEQSNLLFQGSFVVSGVATAVVIRTGNATEFGQLAALSKKEEVRSPVQKKIDTLINQIIAAVGGMAVVAFSLAVLRGTDLFEALRFVMALSVSAVPESLPVAISVVLVLGMRRMAAKKALVRNMRAIETVGVLTTIATDKTGTLTLNKLTVQETWQPESVMPELPELVRRSVNHSEHAKAHDPLDIAMVDYADAEQVAALRHKPLHSLPFDQDVAMSGNVWPHKNGHGYELALKGAPEAILARSTMSEDERERAEHTLHHLTSQGYRVIALATAELAAPIESFAALPARTSLELAGYIAVADSLRPEAAGAVKAALDAGVTVRMITGDHFETAYHIGRQLGMVSRRDQVFDSSRMHTMTDDELARAVADVRVFSRVVPENKYRLLSILKRHNITAMTGDGVNDVPALSNAHVGVAMGSGAQIAKDAGDIILLDDNFKSIIDAMREGRTIISNVRRMLYYLLATNAGEALTMMGALIIGLPLPLVPVQILWVNLVTDTSMVIPLGLEKGQAGAMRHRPERPNAPILNRYLVSRMILVAVTMAVTTLGLYAAFSAAYGHDYGRTIAFCALVVMQWASAFNARSDYESIFSRIFVWSTPFYIGLAVAVGLQMLAVFGPLQGLLHISTVSIGDLVTTGIIAFTLPIILVEVHKYFGRRALRRAGK